MQIVAFRLVADIQIRKVFVIILSVLQIRRGNGDTVLEMAGRQVAKCDQISFWATSFGQKYVYLSPEDLSLGDQL